MKGPLRDRSLGTKLSEVEYARVEAAALGAGVGLSEWCRSVVLRAAADDGGTAPHAALMAELLALRAVLLNVVYRMANGERVNQDEMRQLIERADRDKHRRAAAALGAAE